MSDIQIAPEHGSLERGIAGDYQFSIGATLSEAWAKTNGAKGTINVALALYFLVALGVIIAFAGIALIGGILGGEQTLLRGALTETASQLVSTAVFAPMGAGLFMIGLRRSVDAPISAGTVLAYFHKVLPILLLTLLMYLLIGIGFVLLIIPGIYLVVSYYLALPLLVEKELGVWQALETSRKAVTKRWFAIFGLFLLLGLINFATVFTLFIGMIWTVPMSVIAYGILYRNVFGVEPATLSS